MEYILISEQIIGRRPKTKTAFSFVILAFINILILYYFFIIIYKLGIFRVAKPDIKS